MRAYVFTSKKNNDVIVIIAESSLEAASRLNTDLMYVREGADDYIFANSTKCVEGAFCTATIL